MLYRLCTRASAVSFTSVNRADTSSSSGSSLNRTESRVNGHDTTTEIVVFHSAKACLMYHICKFALLGKAPDALDEIAIAVLVTRNPPAGSSVRTLRPHSASESYVGCTCFRGNKVAKGLVENNISQRACLKNAAVSTCSSQVVYSHSNVNAHCAQGVCLLMQNDRHVTSQFVV